MSNFSHHFILASPLFILVLGGYALVKIGNWPEIIAQALGRFAYNIAMPAMLFRVMSEFSSAPEVDVRLLLAFFGGCFIVFIIGRAAAYFIFRLDGVDQSIFALGGIFSNNVMIGIAVAKLALDEAALPTISLVIVFNALILWTLVTVSVEWARHGSFSLHGFGTTARSIITNPIIASILAGTLWGYFDTPLPEFIDAPLGLLGQCAVPVTLVSLGMELACYRIVRSQLAQSCTICSIKLVLQPLVVWLLARALNLPLLETQTVTLLASLAIGINVYMMAQHFHSLQGPVATAMLLSTFLSSITTPMVISLIS